MTGVILVCSMIFGGVVYCAVLLSKIERHLARMAYPVEFGGGAIGKPEIGNVQAKRP